MNKNLDEIEFTIFDTETTGLEPNSGDRIIEIAGIRFKAGKKIAEFQSLINPQRLVSAAAFSVNRISDDMLKDAPRIEMVMPKFLNFIQGSCLGSYNAGFDIGFLNNELKFIGKALPQDLVIVDVLKMARRLLPGLESYALWFVADELGIKIWQVHRAFGDVELTLRVFEKFKEMLKAKAIFDFKNFSSLFSINPDLLSNLNNQKIAEIHEAIDLKVKLKIKYLSGTNAQVSEREVIPKEIKQEKNNMYLVGFCCLRNEERTFRVDNILHLEIL
jgi:DNA polymerase III epsilon subunit family exonuclease